MRMLLVSLILCLFIMSGCAWNTRQLTNAEQDVLTKLHNRAVKNRKAVQDSLNDIMRISTEALADQHSLSLSISKAKLLESMKSPWVYPHPQLAATQKEVAFYHLYALSEAEGELFDAQLCQRRESIKEVKRAYDKLITRMRQIIESQKIILAHLNQPARARISGFISNVLAETKAFREELAASENPRLRSLAQDVAKAEERLAKVRDLIEKGLAEILKTGGD